MTLDTRARRAAQGIHRAVQVMEMSTPVEAQGRVERFDRFRDRKQRNRRIGAIVLVAALVLTAIIFVGAQSLDQGRGNVPAVPGAHGELILYKVWDGIESENLYTIAADGTGHLDLHVKTDPGARWSPDGTKILVTSKAGPESTHVPLRPAIVDPDGTGFTVLAGNIDPSLNLACTAWSPDGSRLACEGFSEEPGKEDLGGIYTVRASDGGDLVRVTNFQVIPADYSPDGGQIVFSQETGGRFDHDKGTLFVVNADGKGLRAITPHHFVGNSSDASWSPDGQWIAFEHEKLSPRFAAGTKIYLVHPDGTGLHKFDIEDSGFRDVGGPTWSPDGAFLAFQGWPIGANEPDIYVVRVDGSGLHQITDTPGVGERGLDWGPSSE